MTVKEYNQSVEQYSDNIYRFVLKNIKDTEKAKDIVQDTFEKVWKNHTSISCDKVRSYLFSTAYHTLIDSVRRDKYKAEWDKADVNKYFTNESYSDLNELLHQALDKLPPDQKNVILLRDYEGYSYNEIAEITQLSEAQVKVYIYRGRQFLKSYLVKIEILVWVMISTENYEIWMIDYLDGNLSEEDQVRLFQFLAENPHLNEELKGLDNLVLNPVDEVTSPNIIY